MTRQPKYNFNAPGNTSRLTEIKNVIDKQSNSVSIQNSGKTIFKTILELANELDIDKQKVYRYIKKNHINEALQKNGVMYYDDVAQMQIKQAFFKNEVHQNHINDVVSDTLIKQLDMLKNELETKNEQISQLQKQLEQTHKLIDQEQQLRMAENQKVLELATPKKRWWR